MCSYIDSYHFKRAIERASDKYEQKYDKKYRFIGHNNSERVTKGKRGTERKKNRKVNRSFFLIWKSSFLDEFANIYVCTYGENISN